MNFCVGVDCMTSTRYTQRHVGGRSPNSIQFCCYYIYIWDSSLPKIVKVETHFLKKTGLCVNKISFLPRDAMYKRGLCRHAVSVCLSVCSSRS